MNSTVKISRNLSNLCKLLKEQFNWTADPQSFERTYAGRVLKSGGAFSWLLTVTDKNNYTFVIGSCYPLKAFARKDTILEFSLSWGDTEIFPYTPEEYKRVLELRKERKRDC